MGFSTIAESLIPIWIDLQRKIAISSSGSSCKRGDQNDRAVWNNHHLFQDVIQPALRYELPSTNIAITNCNHHQDRIFGSIS